MQQGPLPFQSDFTRALGGTSLHWLGTCLRMLPNDFELQQPLRPGRRLAAGVRAICARTTSARSSEIIGVAGSVTSQHYPGIDNTEYFGHAYDYPMQRIPASYLDTQLERKLAGRRNTSHGAWRNYHRCR